MSDNSFERKKMTNVYILDILKRYTDTSYDRDGKPLHCLTQAQIVEKLRKDYYIELDRKAVGRGLNDLINSPEYCDKIDFDTEIRKINGGNEETEIRTNYRYCHDFDPAQIRLLMDAVLFSKNISESECRQLLELISKLGNVNSRSRLSKHLRKLSDLSVDKVANDQLLGNIEIIDEAIENGRQIAYIYNNYGKDKKLHPRLDPDGKPLVRTVNPYSMQAANGRYYLVCNYDEYDNTQNARIDKITDIEILDTPVKPKNKVSGFKGTPSTLTELMYMQPGNSERILFKADDNENFISEMIDWFGKSIKFLESDGKSVVCEIKANPKAIRYWAMQYSDRIEIISPESLREEIKESLRFAWRKYNNGSDYLIESDEGIRKLVYEWSEICNKATSKKAEERTVDIKALSLVVKKTHSILAPVCNSSIEGSNALLMLKLKEFAKNTGTVVLSDAHCISLILEALIREVEHPQKGAAEDIISVLLRKYKGGRICVNIDINNFEEDYLTLKQYTDKDAENARKSNEELRERIRKKHKEQMEQRRKEKSKKGE